MKLKSTKRHYSTEFKLEEVQQVVLHQQRVVDVARSLAIDTSTLGKWVRQYKAERFCRINRKCPSESALVVFYAIS
ncbi:transposase [Xenorhabdus hominickii]|uniref:Transposase n=1 Tax=Xenorhabdus hominickii TaxID=351679 RepID=A0A1V0M4B2_XENHO|nr:transposase [Xenorhabdus hominickii]ARD69705.1 Transposase [Xenorhabdus hominickii]PHM51507.1 transposase [Xenorhabdus hominickii]